jgi:hypothetical protein
MARKSTRKRIDDKLAELRNRPRDAEAGIRALPPTDRPAIYRAAFALGPGDEKIAQLFADGDLDPTNPFHWQMLARALAELRCGLGKRGRRPKWTSPQLSQLLNDFDRIRSANPNWSRSKICRHLVTLEHYKKLELKWTTLRRRLQDALDPRKNLLLQHILDGRHAGDREQRRDTVRRARKGWGRKAAFSVDHQLLEEIINTIGTGWLRVERSNHRLPNKIGSRNT